MKWFIVNVVYKVCEYYNGIGNIMELRCIIGCICGFIDIDGVCFKNIECKFGSIDIVLESEVGGVVI